MDLKIAGKKALMAGGSAGMGRATAERLAEAGVELFEKDYSFERDFRRGWTMQQNKHY